MKKYLILFLALQLASVSIAQQKPAKPARESGKTPARQQSRTQPAARPGSAVQDGKADSGDSDESASDFAKIITAAELKRHLVVLASDEYEGRATGEKGQKMAAAYIADHFAKSGLTPPPGLNAEENPFYQSFELEKRSWGEVYMTVNGKRAEFLKDFYSLGADIEKEITMPVVFAGYGIEEGGYSDYTQLDVTGKAVLVLMGEPVDAKGVSLVTGTSKVSAWATDWRQKQRLAARKGAGAIIFIADGNQKAFEQTISRLHHWIDQPTMGFPDKEQRKARTGAFFVSPDLGARMAGTTAKRMDKYRADIRKKGRILPAPFRTDDRKVAIKAERKRETFITENILGYVEGTDLKEELLVITAHYDHLGIQDGKVYNGADDDGSGTVAVMMMAQAFAQAKANGMGPRRSILFMPVTGEEKGLLGSEYYANNPVVPLEQTVANLNIDMIGRTDDRYKDNPNYVYIIGSDRLSTELHTINEVANRLHTNLTLDYTYNSRNDPNQFYYRSDHYNFAKNGIPIIFYFNGTHEDYHQHTDTVDKILFDKMQTITRLVFHTAWEIANRDNRPEIDKDGE